MPGYFVTGTDTGVGKTWVTVALMQGLKARGLRVAAMKPVATGGSEGPEGLRNVDALQLQEASSLPLTYPEVNPFVYAPAVSPHIAARLEGRLVDMELITEAAHELESRADLLMVEGVGGWEVPLGDDWRVSDLAMELAFPVVLVVGLRLGCLNHAILSYEAIVRAGLECAGWVANHLTADFEYAGENIQTLQRELPAHFLGNLPFVPDSGKNSSKAPHSFPGNTLDIDEFLRRFNG